MCQERDIIKSQLNTAEKDRSVISPSLCLLHLAGSKFKLRS